MTFVGNAGTGNPISDYSSRDYASVYSDLVNRIPTYLPEWTSRSNSDFGLVLAQMFAYSVDLIGYYLDRLAGEAFIQTATQSVSVLNLAAMLDYQPSLSAGATVVLQITIGSGVTGPIDIPAGSQFSTVPSPTQAPIIFTTTADLTIAGAGGATASFVGFVEAVQGVPFNNEPVATSDGSINQAYGLRNTPVSADSFTVMVDIGLGPQEWNYAPSLIVSGPFDQVYTNFVDANGVFYIIFGDGVNGFVPPLGSPITCSYQTNSGTLGNVGQNTITQPVSALIGVIAVTNPANASGGVAAESIQSIQQKAPASLKALNRAVTVADIETLAMQVPGVEWASAQEVTYQLVNLYIAPFGGGPPSALLQQAVLNYINPRVMANTTVTIFAPTYVPVNITADVVLFPQFGNTSTKNLLLGALATMLAQVNTGFGYRVSLGLVYQTILEQVPGVNYAIVLLLNRQLLGVLVDGLSSGGTYTVLITTETPNPIFDGDLIILNPGSLPTQSLSADGDQGAGSDAVFVHSFTANADYPIDTPVQDASGTNDQVLLPNEIPVVGTITLNVSGGIPGS